MWCRLRLGTCARASLYETLLRKASKKRRARVEVAKGFRSTYGAIGCNDKSNDANMISCRIVIKQASGT